MDVRGFLVLNCLLLQHCLFSLAKGFLYGLSMVSVFFLDGLFYTCENMSAVVMNAQQSYCFSKILKFCCSGSTDSTVALL